MINPWNPLQPPSRSPGAGLSGATDWQDFAETQQRWWTEWAEAGRLWLSWWYSTLPPMPWPPAGTVLPPVETSSAVNHAPTQPGPAQQTMASVTPIDKAAARKPRAASARHH